MGVDAEGEPAFHTRKETTRERHGAAQTHLHKGGQRPEADVGDTRSQSQVEKTGVGGGVLLYCPLLDSGGTVSE